MSFGYINVHGLKNKLKFLDIEFFFNKHDIVCLTETFIMPEEIECPLNDLVTIPGFKCIHKTRIGNTRKRSGGIAIAIKEYLIPYIDYIQNDCVNSIWCKIKSEFVCTTHPIFIACIYVPPVNSIYADKECFYDLENEFLINNNVSPNIIVFGDWNSHIKDNLEIFMLNESKDDEESEFLNTLSTANTLQELNLPLKRMSLDNSPLNAWGKLFLNFCKNTGLIIVNGRYGPSSCKNTTIFNTTVDYMLCSIYMIKDVIDMQVHDFDPLLSDVHCAIETNIDITINKYPANETGTLQAQTPHEKNEEIFKANRWENGKKR